ncbi:unnamed protein product [Amoebophrya sp. A120]|nr:unnamed protein product [Amoebophrya sp. A120]|eukprot:GSA120T00023991001.1
MSKSTSPTPPDKTALMRAVMAQGGQIRCFRCQEVLTPESDFLIHEDGHHFHRNCFRCVDCGQIITSAHHVATPDGRLHCAACSLPHCDRCGEYITGAMIISPLDSDPNVEAHFHPQCFLCVTCGKVIEGPCYHDGNDGHRCEKCEMSHREEVATPPEQGTYELGGPEPESFPVPIPVPKGSKTNISARTMLSTSSAEVEAGSTTKRDSSRLFGTGVGEVTEENLFDLDRGLLTGSSGGEEPTTSTTEKSSKKKKPFVQPPVPKPSANRYNENKTPAPLPIGNLRPGEKHPTSALYTDLVHKKAEKVVPHFTTPDHPALDIPVFVFTDMDKYSPEDSATAGTARAAAAQPVQQPSRSELPLPAFTTASGMDVTFAPSGPILQQQRPVDVVQSGLENSVAATTTSTGTTSKRKSVAWETAEHQPTALTTLRPMHAFTDLQLQPKKVVRDSSAAIIDAFLLGHKAPYVELPESIANSPRLSTSGGSSPRTIDRMPDPPVVAHNPGSALDLDQAYRQVFGADAGVSASRHSEFGTAVPPSWEAAKDLHPRGSRNRTSTAVDARFAPVFAAAQEYPGRRLSGEVKDPRLLAGELIYREQQYNERVPSREPRSWDQQMNRGSYTGYQPVFPTQRTQTNATQTPNFVSAINTATQTQQLPANNGSRSGSPSNQFAGDPRDFPAGLLKYNVNKFTDQSELQQQLFTPRVLNYQAPTLRTPRSSFLNNNGDNEVQHHELITNSAMSKKQERPLFFRQMFSGGLFSTFSPAQTRSNSPNSPEEVKRQLRGPREFAAVGQQLHKDVESIFRRKVPHPEQQLEQLQNRATEMKNQLLFEVVHQAKRSENFQASDKVLSRFSIRSSSNGMRRSRGATDGKAVDTDSALGISSQKYPFFAFNASGPAREAGMIPDTAYYEVSSDVAVSESLHGDVSHAESENAGQRAASATPLLRFREGAGPMLALDKRIRVTVPKLKVQHPPPAFKDTPLVPTPRGGAASVPLPRTAFPPAPQKPSDMNLLDEVELSESEQQPSRINTSSVASSKKTAGAGTTTSALNRKIKGNNAPLLRNIPPVQLQIPGVERGRANIPAYQFASSGETNQTSNQLQRLSEFGTFVADLAVTSGTQLTEIGSSTISNLGPVLTDIGPTMEKAANNIGPAVEKAAEVLPTLLGKADAALVTIGSAAQQVVAALPASEEVEKAIDQTLALDAALGCENNDKVESEPEVALHREDSVEHLFFRIDHSHEHGSGGSYHPEVHRKSGMSEMADALESRRKRKQERKAEEEKSTGIKTVGAPSPAKPPVPGSVQKTSFTL